MAVVGALRALIHAIRPRWYGVVGQVEEDMPYPGGF
jgi:hypothetical protein